MGKGLDAQRHSTANPGWHVRCSVQSLTLWMMVGPVACGTLRWSKDGWRSCVRTTSRSDVDGAPSEDVVNRVEPPSGRRCYLKVIFPVRKSY